MSCENILVTGASGFVGTALLDQLVIEAKFNKLFALHRNTLHEDMKSHFDSRVSWLKADITTDNLSQAVEGIDTVYHLAAYSSTGESSRERELMEKINVFGTERLAIACKKAGVRHFIFISSIAACETCRQSAVTQMIVDESNGYPISSYGKSKKMAEDILLKMAGNEFEVTIFRPTALFGENHLGSIYELVRTINRGRFVMFGKGDNHCNFYYIKDFIEVLVAAKNNEQCHGELFIASGNRHKLKELVSCINSALGRKQSTLRIPFILGYWIATCCDLVTKLTGKALPLSKRRLNAMTRDVIYSNDKLSRKLKVTSSIGVFDGIRNTIGWYQKNNLI